MAFTEQGVAMLSGILNSKRAVAVNIAIMRTFVGLRKLMLSNKNLADKINDLESATKEKFKDHDKKIQLIFDAIKELMIEKNEPRELIGFKIKKK